MGPVSLDSHSGTLIPMSKEENETVVHRWFEEVWTRGRIVEAWDAIIHLLSCQRHYKECEIFRAERTGDMASPGNVFKQHHATGAE